MLRSALMRGGLRAAGSLGYPVGRALRVLDASVLWSAAEIRAHQGAALQRLMAHCYEQVPYYRDVMRARGLRPEDFRTVDDLGRLPRLTRDLIREHRERLRATGYPDVRCQFRRSGGTTGEPIEVAVDRRARGWEVAAYLRGFEWMRYRYGRPMVRLFGGSLGIPSSRGPRTRLREWLMRNWFLPAFELGPDNVDQYVSVIRRACGGVLVGYASAVRNLAQYVSDRGLDVGDGLASVICTAEYMPQAWRDEIALALRAPVFCYYGCGEIHSIAYECDGVADYLVAQEHVVLEVQGDDNGEGFCDRGRGEAVITALFNYAMPLIRYSNGDAIEVGYRDTGPQFQRILHLEGRVVDQLVAADGHRVSGALIPHMVLRSRIPAWKYQVVQTRPREIHFHYLCDGKEGLTDATKAELESVFRHHLGDDLCVTFVIGEFEATPSGKHRFVINRMASSAG